MARPNHLRQTTKTKTIRCIETGKEYFNGTEAEQDTCVKGVYRILAGKTKRNKLHFEWINKEEKNCNNFAEILKKSFD